MRTVPEIREKVEEHLRLVIDIAKEHSNRGLGFLDLIQEGIVGLTKAAESYDGPNKLFPFYASMYIRKHIRMAIGAEGSR